MIDCQSARFYDLIDCASAQATSQAALFHLIANFTHLRLRFLFLAQPQFLHEDSQ